MRLAVVLWMCLGLAGQAPPDFSGQWSVKADAPQAGPGKGPPRGDMGSGFGASFTITQDARQLIVEQPLFSRYDLQPPVKLVISLDGSESKNAVMVGHATQMRTSRAKWDGQSLQITTVYPAVDPATGKPFTTEVTQRLTLESPSTLTIDVTRAGALGAKPTTSRTVYQKA